MSDAMKYRLAMLAAAAYIVGQALNGGLYTTDHTGGNFIMKTHRIFGTVSACGKIGDEIKCAFIGW